MLISELSKMNTKEVTYNKNINLIRKYSGMTKLENKCLHNVKTPPSGWHSSSWKNSWFKVRLHDIL